VAAAGSFQGAKDGDAAPVAAAEKKPADPAEDGAERFVVHYRANFEWNENELEHEYIRRLHNYGKLEDLHRKFRRVACGALRDSAGRVRTFATQAEARLHTRGCVQAYLLGRIDEEHGKHEGLILQDYDSDGNELYDVDAVPGLNLKAEERDASVGCFSGVREFRYEVGAPLEAFGVLVTCSASAWVESEASPIPRYTAESGVVL